MLWLFPSNSLSLTFPSWLYFLKSTLEFSWWNSMWLPHKLSMKCSFAGIRGARVSISHFRRKSTAESVSWKIKWQKVLKVCNIINSSEYVIENSMRTHASFIQWKGWHSFAIILNDENQLSYDPCGHKRALIEKKKAVIKLRLRMGKLHENLKNKKKDKEGAKSTRLKD